MTKTTKPNSISRAYCNVFGHNYKVSKQVTSHVKEYRCKSCKKELTTNSNGCLTELTPTFREINSILEHIHTSRMLRLKQKTVTSSIY
jgi:hypothetical protein